MLLIIWKPLGASFTQVIVYSVNPLALVTICIHTGCVILHNYTAAQHLNIK